MAGTAVTSALFSPDIRLSTFPEEWPHTEENLSPRVLADNGFLFTGSSGKDEVQCFACGKVLDGWEPQDDVFQEHQRRNECIYLTFLRRGGDPRNMPLRVGLEILRCIYDRRIASIESTILEKSDILNALVKAKKTK